MRLLVNIVFFFVGAALGVWWGVYHPVAAVRVATYEQQKVQQVESAAQADWNAHSNPPPAQAPATPHN